MQFESLALNFKKALKPRLRKTHINLDTAHRVELRWNLPGHGTASIAMANFFQMAFINHLLPS